MQMLADKVNAIIFFSFTKHLIVSHVILVNKIVKFRWIIVWSGELSDESQYPMGMNQWFYIFHEGSL